jgi:hypothetical protein
MSAHLRHGCYSYLSRIELPKDTRQMSSRHPLSENSGLLLTRNLSSRYYFCSPRGLAGDDDPSSRRDDQVMTAAIMMGMMVFLVLLLLLTAIGLRRRKRWGGHLRFA